MTSFAPPYAVIPLGLHGPLASFNWSSEDSFALDGTTDKLAFLLQSPAAGPLTDLLLRIPSIAGTPPTYLAHIRNVTSAGDPGTTSHAAQGFRPTTTGDLLVTYSSPTTLAIGQRIAISFEYDTVTANTIDASNRASIRYNSRMLQFYGSGFPFPAISTNGTTWSRQTTYAPAWAAKINGIWYGLPFSTGVTPSATSATGQRRALKFQLPDPWESLTVIGARVHCPPSLSGTFEYVMRLRNSADTAVLSSTIRHQLLASTGPNSPDILFDDAHTIPAGEWYRLGVEQTTANGTYWRYLQLPSSTYREAFPGGDRICWSEHDATSWTDYTDRITAVSLLCTDYTVAGGGGSFVAPSRRLVLPPSTVYRRRFDLIAPPPNVTVVNTLVATNRTRQVDRQQVPQRQPSRIIPSPVDRPVAVPFPTPARREVRESIRVAHRSHNVPSTVDRQVVIPSPARRERTMAVIPHRRREFVPSVVDRQIVVPAAAKRERATSIVALPRLRYLPSIVDRQVVIPGAPRREHRTATVVDRRRELISSREQVVVPCSPRREHRSTTILARHRELITSRNDVLVPAPARRHPIHTTSTRLARKLLPYETIRTEQVPLPQRPRVIVRTVQVPRRQLVAGALLASIVTTTNVVMVQSRRTVR